MMVDEFLDDDERAEWLKRLIKENWLWVVAGIAIGIGGLFGWRGWNAHLDERARAAEDRVTAMLAAFDANDRDQGIAIAGELTGEYGRTPYADQARLVLARVHVEGGDLPAAATELETVMNGSSDPELALVARTRLARVQMAQGAYDAALATLDGAKALAVGARLQELRGDILVAKGDRAAALTAYQAAATAAEGEAGGVVDRQLLQLKIDDLAGADASTAAVPAAP